MDQLRKHYPRMDLAGQRFGRLVLIKRSDDGANRAARWLCQCDCGTTKVHRQQHLRSGKAQSCGCLRGLQLGDRVRKHGRSNAEIYNTWVGMKARCFHSEHEAYPYYGGRGITVCDAWLNSFDQFEADIGPRPSPTHSIDRIDNDGHYEPGNCRWATKKEQRANQRPARRAA